MEKHNQLKKMKILTQKNFESLVKLYLKINQDTHLMIRAARELKCNANVYNRKKSL